MRSSPLKILLLNYEYPPLGGGAGNATKYILREYARDSLVEVDVVTSSIDEKYHLEQVSKYIHIHRLPIGKTPHAMRHQSRWEIIRYTWKAFWFSRTLCKRDRYHVVHAFFGIPCGVIALLLKKLFQVPYIVSLRGADVPGYSERFTFLYPLIRPIVVCVWKHAARVVSNSQGLKRLAQESSSDIPIDVIYNGIDTDVFSPSSFVPTKEEVRLLCASRLSTRKGFVFVIEAVGMLAPKFPALRLTIAGGSGNAETDLKKKVKELGLGDKITFTGEYNHEQLLTIQRSSDIFVFPSFNEGMSNSMLEAMACGLPVIMTPTGGAQELIRDGENGFLVAFGDARDIASKIEQLLIDPQKRRQMSVKSRETALSMRWENVAWQYQAVYLEIIGNSF